MSDEIEGTGIGFYGAEPVRPHRIDVERCGLCPFMRGTATYPRCDHPTIQRVMAGKFLMGDEPPDWCPLRGRPTIVTGPGVVAGLRLAVEAGKESV